MPVHLGTGHQRQTKGMIPPKSNLVNEFIGLRNRAEVKGNLQDGE